MQIDHAPRFDVSFVANGGTEVASQNTVVVSRSPSSERLDYELAGWFVSAALDGAPVKFPLRLNSNLTLYAKWVWAPDLANHFTFTLNEDDTYTITGLPAKEYSGHVEIPAEYNGRAVTVIGRDAFNGQAGITAVTIPEGIREIGMFAFRETSIADLTVPASVQNIDDAAFAAIAALTQVTFNEGLIRIGLNAFRNCAKLAQINFIPDTVEEIGADAFSGTLINIEDYWNEGEEE
jgi:hypothetical protein